jgi:hypothetical protein
MIDGADRAVLRAVTFLTTTLVVKPAVSLTGPHGHPCDSEQEQKHAAVQNQA